MFLPSVNIAAQQQPQYQERNTEEVFKSYWKAFLNKDLDALMALYSEDAVFIGSQGVVEKGAKTILESLEAGFSSFFPSGMEQEPLFHRIEGPIAYQVYSLINTETGEKLLPFATDTFVVRDGKIIYHTMAAYFPGMEIVASPSLLPAPEDWNVVTTPLPRRFAPDLYQGIADYYFSPGMFNADAEDYFTYTMVFWIENDLPQQEEELEKDLQIYFDGLTQGNRQEIDQDKIQEEINMLLDSLSAAYSLPVEKLRSRADLEAVKTPNNWNKSYRGIVQTYDALVAHSRLSLNTDLLLKKCGEYTVMLVNFSPQLRSHQVWNELNELQRHFKCPSPE